MAVPPLALQTPMPQGSAPPLQVPHAPNAKGNSRDSAWEAKRLARLQRTAGAAGPQPSALFPSSSPTVLEADLETPMRRPLSNLQHVFDSAPALPSEAGKENARENSRLYAFCAN